MEKMYLKVTVISHTENSHSGDLKTKIHISNLTPAMVIAIAEGLIKQMKHETNLN